MRKYIFLLLFLTCCSSDKIPASPPSLETNYQLCELAQEHLYSMCTADDIRNSYCCEIVKPTKKGKSYSQFCREKMFQGVDLNPQCVAEVTACGQIDFCTGSQ